MVFSSILFLFSFLPLVLIIYYLAPRRYRNLVLYVASLLFYAWGEPVYVLLMLFSTVSVYVHALLVDRYRENKAAARFWLSSSIFINLALLAFFKYANLLVPPLNRLPGVSLPLLALPLPIGISFYTFQSMSYAIDVYRGHAPVQRHIINFGMYIAFFPQLIAGPIVRYQTIAEQLNHRVERPDIFAAGIRRFVLGLGKKVLLANNIGILWQQIRIIEPAELTVLASWLGIFAFALQIYFDFSGYSDMAIGLGKLFGFSIPENFNYPYLANSMAEFWRRWHISLGTWFREYLYIPLGGNRGPRLMLYRNLFVVWLLTGLWHGACGNYIIWGLYHGLLIALEKTVFLKGPRPVPPFFRHLYVCFFTLIGWVLFAFEDMGAGGRYLLVMFGLTGSGLYNSQALYFLYTHALLLAISVLCALPLSQYIRPLIAARFHTTLYYAAAGAAQFVVLFLSIAYLVDSTYNPFLYFRF